VFARAELSRLNVRVKWNQRTDYAALTSFDDNALALQQLELAVLRLAAPCRRGLMLHQLGFDVAQER
jgi:hypothetical protein